MRYLLMAVLAGLFVISPAFAERDNDERHEKRGRREKGDNDRNERKYNKRKKALWGIMKQISAEERKRLRQLHASNPDEWRKEVAKVVKRIRQEKQESDKKNRQEKQELNKKIRGLVNQYKNAKDDKTKKRAMDKLRQITRKIFLAKMQKNKKRLESLEKHVKKLRQQYNFRQKNADKIIQSRLNTLTSDTKFNW